ncbi:hypothetical protein HAQ00_00760 [Acidithiobacillus caldus ATCC 51756]|jgi:hypothetical protein|uniref:hypothetical protein n=1 Tax=Acidithiobacillus caldus TaxID=33059 RepID=UPI001C069231|nr:hypothetical protein [Acidithiobacillus caldus]MBU2734283.1 hypothetical protein [Acidithiobacillus caldus ATCC 51756]MBU2801735.1 hypothetical protein [Acidithiobacillus caldus]
MVHNQEVPSIPVIPQPRGSAEPPAVDGASAQQCTRLQEWIAYAERHGIRAAEQKAKDGTGTIAILVFRKTLQGCRVEVLMKPGQKPALYTSQQEADAKIRQLMEAPQYTEYGEIGPRTYMAVHL